MNKMAAFVENDFPIFLSGAVFGKLIEMSGFAQSIVIAVALFGGATFTMDCVPGTPAIGGAMLAIPNPLLNEAITINLLAGIVGSASGGMDSLPHNGTVITIMAVCGLNHREAYPSSSGSSSARPSPLSLWPESPT